MAHSELLKKVVDDLLRENNVKLKLLMQNVLQTIAGEFWKVGLIEQQVADSMFQLGVSELALATKLFNACQTSLVLYPQKNFPKFIEVLNEYETMKPLAAEMKSEFRLAYRKAMFSELVARYPLTPGEKDEASQLLASQDSTRDYLLPIYDLTVLVFKRHYAELCGGLSSSPEEAGAVLYSNGLMTMQERSQVEEVQRLARFQKAELLVQAIERRIVAEKSSAPLKKFCQVLQGHPVVGSIVSRMMVELAYLEQHHKQHQQQHHPSASLEQHHQPHDDLPNSCTFV